MIKVNYQLQPISQKQFFDNWRTTMSDDIKDNHRQRLLKKFGVTSSAELVIKALVA